MPPSHGPGIFGLSFKVILLTFLASVHILLNFLVNVHILWNVVVNQGPWYHWYLGLQDTHLMVDLTK